MGGRRAWLCDTTAADLHKVSCGATGRVFALPSCYAQLKITIEMYVDVVAFAVAATVPLRPLATAPGPASLFICTAKNAK